MTGENGILTQANNAKDATEKASFEEQVKIAVLGSQSTNGKINNEDLKNNLNQIVGIEGVPDTITDESFPLVVKSGDNEVTINSDGSVEDITYITIEQAKDNGMLEESENSMVKVDDGTFKLPAGFKVSEDSANNIQDGIVIEDVNQNQFVWIPVTDGSKYIRNRTYIGETFSESAITDTGYLPDELQPDLNGETTQEGIGKINEAAETAIVLKAGGFYIARFETGIEGTDTLVSKKGATLWNDKPQEEAKIEAKNMVNTTHAKTALCSGIQWDVVMEFVNQKLDGATPAQTFDVRTGSDARHVGNVPEPSGENVADKVCNIYDLEGNCYEFVAELVKDSNDNYNPLIRGGANGSTYEASSRAMILKLGSLPDVSFRAVLYVI